MKRSGQTRVLFPLSLSLLAHIALAVLVFVVHAPARGSEAKIFSVTMIKAPAGPRDVGVVTKEPPRADTKSTPPKSAPPRTVKNTVKTPDKNAAKSTVDPKRATAVPEPAKAKSASPDESKTASSKAASPPRAGGGATGKTGTDVVDAVFKGLEFSDPVYLQNIITQVMHNFPEQQRALVAEFSFEILRDGCVQNIRMTKGSVDGLFNAQAMSAINKASRNCAFGRLPAAWKDEILKVEFVFDPRVIR